MAAPFDLRDYQVDAVEGLRQSYRSGHHAPLLQLATGGGKTLIFGEITRSAAVKGKRILITAHRRELIRQCSEKLDWAGVPHGIIAPNLDRDHDRPVLVGSIQTIGRRLDHLGQFDLIVFDEAHHARADTWARLIEHQPQAYLLGVTATPCRTDGRGLGIEADGYFDHLVCGPTTKQLIEDGWLSPVRCFVPLRRVNTAELHIRAGEYIPEEAAAAASTRAIVGSAIEHYDRCAAHQPAIAFCATVAHAEFIAAEFRNAGYRAHCVHGNLPRDERDDLILGLGSGDVEVLTSCALIDEGLDVPAVAAVILLRPTKSVVLHRQQIGRGMRPAPGKEALIVNDHCGNCLAHGLPETEPFWTLAGIDKRKGEAPVWECPQCHCIIPLAVAICPDCGFERPSEEGGRKAPVRVPGTLTELSVDSWVVRLGYREFIHRFACGELTETDAYAYAAARGYRRGWVWHLVQERQGRAAAMG
jgi:DNA repair protein RadD